jgi:hypothetical protein
MRNLVRRWWLGNEEGIAVDVQGDRLIVATGALRGALPPRVWSVPLSAPLSLELESGSRDGVETIVRGLRDCLFDLETRYARFGVSLPTRSTFVARYPDAVSLPLANFQPIREWAFRAFSLDEVAHRLRIISYPVEDSYARCIVIATKHAVIDFWERVARALGIELVMIVPRAQALYLAGSEAERETNNNQTMWIDITERTPCVHRFTGFTLVDSIVVDNARGDENFFHEIVSEWRMADFSAGTDSGIKIKCVFSANQTPEQARKSTNLHAVLAGDVEWLSDDTMVARRVLRMMGE